MVINYYYNPEVRFLLMNQSNEKTQTTYQSLVIKAPMIGPRPPCYTHPCYEQYYPVI